MADRIVKPRAPRYSMAEPAGATYGADTEVLTRAGWKTFPQVVVGSGSNSDEFATRNADGQFEWQHATARFDQSWTGELIRIKGRTTDLHVTPQHRLLTRWSDNRAGTYGELLKPAGRITVRGAELPCLSEWTGEPASTVRFGRYEWDTVTFASLLGAWLAEGSLGPARVHVPKSNRRCPTSGVYAGTVFLTQLPGTKGYEPYRELLVKMLGREPARSTNKDWVFSCAPLWHYLSRLGKAATKRIPRQVKDWGRPELEALLHFYLLGDGWLRTSMAGNHSWGAVTVSTQLAGDLQEVAQKVGKFATIVVRQPRDGGTFEGGRTIKAENCRPGYYLSFNTSACRTVQPVEPVAYAGTVHSVSVPNQTLYVRREGSPVWSGSATMP
jgi:hypothetical protein